MDNLILSLENISKRFGATPVLKGITLTVAGNEIFFLLGPSGCGKTTLLRIIAGFCQPDSGRILLDGQDITGVPAHQRHIGLVFQNYALWPHLTVWENVAYGLKLRKLPEKFVHQRVEEMLTLTHLLPQKNLYPSQLSGGQQQRVALARSLIVRPRLLLLDEPLSNLDANLREQMRQEIKKIQKETGITMIYVTHDQREALTMAHRLAVMNAGEIVQTGTPLQIYFEPGNRFVADFVGTVNLLAGKVSGFETGLLQVETSEGLLRATGGGDFSSGQAVEIGFRPESISLRPGQSNVFRTTVTETENGEGIMRVMASSPGGRNFLLHLPLETGRKLQA
ncbi:MAG TPA: ABC transporter ATP-binding protein, partial [bacterium]|nr:ABC transporter ATP-binding protein [bacterium]